MKNIDVSSIPNLNDCSFLFYDLRILSSHRKRFHGCGNSKSEGALFKEKIRHPMKRNYPNTHVHLLNKYYFISCGYFLFEKFKRVRSPELVHKKKSVIDDREIFRIGNLSRD